MKAFIHKEIEDFVAAAKVETKWGIPIVGFAEANSDYFLDLKEIVGKDHVQPKTVLKDASIVIAYYVPLLKQTAESNRAGRLSSKEWAVAYEQTNQLFSALNCHLIYKLKEKGYEGAVTPEADTFDRCGLISNWSQRHVAYLAGLGTFGLNNMLITEKGCCGRFSSVITNLDVVPNRPRQDQLCLYKKNGTCGLCAKSCPSGALTKASYDRKACFAICQENAEIFCEFENSYEAGEQTGSEVCGKCMVAMPCSFS